jgi:hypothetical protein
MKTILLLFVFSMTALADDNAAQMVRARQKVQEAVIATQTIQTYKKRAEHTVYTRLRETTGISKRHVAYAAPLISLVEGKIDTRKIKKIQIRMGYIKVRPDVVYNFRSKETAGQVSVGWGF